MSVKQFCDRCEAEVFKIPTLKITDDLGSESWYICEACVVGLRRWIEGEVGS